MMVLSFVKRLTIQMPLIYNKGQTILYLITFLKVCKMVN